MTSETGAIAFAERVLTLLDKGSFTATYKYAVLLGLMDLCMERASAKGDPPQVLTTRQLAEKVVELYWPHTVPYGSRSKAEVLRQNSRGQAEIVTLIHKFRESLPADPMAPLHRARATQPHRFERLVRNVEWKLIEMPLPRLQTLGGGDNRFVYEIAWDRSVRLVDVRRYQKGSTGTFDNRILLKSRVGEYLVQLNGLLRPLIHRQWAALVARFNRMEEAKLERFLFGAERVGLEPVRGPLLELQNGKCFYCGRGVRAQAEVDHFIPWSRCPDDGLDNLVVADRACNGKKRDFLAAAAHLRPWRERMSDPAMDDICSDTHWFRDPTGTLGVARTIYLRLPADTPLWAAPGEFESAGRKTWEVLLD